MNADMIMGAEILEKRVREKIQYMPYQQVIDEGGLLGILNKEYVKMVDEWTNETDRQFAMRNA